MRKGSVIAVMLALLLSPSASQASQTLTAVKTDTPPRIDGNGSDEVWKKAEALILTDKRTEEEVSIRSVYGGDAIYFLVTFPDAGEDRYHKPWVWNKDAKVYKLGPQREDTFTFKWNMESREVDLSNFSDDDYRADVWYWKAGRTDPAGYSDDKMHLLSSEAGKKSKELISKSGKKRYLIRKGDAGRAAQKKRILTSYKSDVEDQYESQQPDGSHADIKARGIWKDGRWTIEFGRKLKTGHDDDIQFDTAEGRKYLFGISIPGLYGEGIDKSKPHPYGQGRLSDPIYLLFK